MKRVAEAKKKSNQLMLWLKRPKPCQPTAATEIVDDKEVEAAANTCNVTACLLSGLAATQVVIGESIIEEVGNISSGLEESETTEKEANVSIGSII